MPKLLLNSIVKNESARILRMLNSVAPHISAWVITDTGSTDGTPEIIEDFFKMHGIPGHITRAPFIDFSQARNAALQAAQTSSYDFDYIILVDADMELKVIANDWTQFFTDARSYDMFQCAGMLHYQNRRLVRRGEQHGYLGVTHEYLNVDTGGCLPKEVAHFIDHADGANRPDKFKRDIKLLKKGLKNEPENVRYLYYLAQSYRDAGETKKAIEFYQKRVDAGGWDEEVWSAMLFIALCWKDLGKEAKFIRAALEAYNFRPQRAESLYELSKYFREKNNHQEVSIIFAEAGVQIPPTQDALFVNDYVYQCGMWDEFAVSAFYSKLPLKKIMGFRAANMLALKRGPYTWSRDLAQQNMFFYLPPLVELAPSWKAHEISFKAPENWIAMNPSVTIHGNRPAAIIRTVNYRMDEEGRYLIRGLADGTVNNSNPINTRNWLVSFDDTLKIHGEPKEIFAPADLPCGYPLVIGFEDMRLWSHKGELWTNSTVRQIDPDGMAEQVLARIEGDQLVDVKRMLRTPRLYEKNWANITGSDDIRFMYRPGHVVDGNGQDVVQHQSIWEIGHFAGGSQVVEIPGAWIYLIHEARHIPGTHLRYYTHRFVKFDADFKVTKVSVPFCLQEKVIEFVAGMCLMGDKLVISYGFKDCEAKIGTVLLSDVERFLNAS